jgi:DNA polymerase-3 subunit delta'
MGFTQFNEQQATVALLQRSLERGRLGHAYLLSGGRLEELEALAGTLAKTLNCLSPPRRAANGLALDCCDTCLVCRKIEGNLHADVQWLRPESKSRVIRVEQMRDLLQTVHLKPTEARFKVAVIVAADRLQESAANAFLKTLEEPPANSILLLLTTEPARVLETIVSRCLRLSVGGSARPHAPDWVTWVKGFAVAAAAQSSGLLNRYRLLGVVLERLGEVRARIEKTLGQRSPLERYDDVAADLRDKWEEELAAAIEAEYRRQRTELLAAVQWWLRDVWLRKLGADPALLGFPEFAAASDQVAARLSERDAMANLQVVEQTQRLLYSNVQEALALEVGLLRLKL